MASLTLSAQLPTQTSSISKSQPINETITDLNILLLGETGVGKTTFINAFFNHLTYNTLDEAIKGNMIVVIPASFSITDPNTYDSKVIQIGTPDENENNSEDGHSKTQGCKSYVFPVGNRNLRLIDAPGIGDTRGVDQDAKNFEHILAFISQYKHLDGICILLKPNEQTLNVFFRFCVKELLTHLHVSAKNNIMFVFTFARPGFLEIGHTVSLLKILLKELCDKTGVNVPFTPDNTFSFNNESFRFLAVQENGVEYLSEQVQEFSKSWNMSGKEYGNLVDRVVNCSPHMVRDTLSINEAQQLIRKLHRPIAEVARLIEENIQLAEKHKVERQTNATTTTNDMSGTHISVPQYSAEVIPLPYPRTVCTSKTCTSIVFVEGKRKVDYKTHCHEHCYLRGVEQEVIKNSALKKCAAMNWKLGLCQKCTCSWSTHMHVTYEYRTCFTSIKIALAVNDPINNSSRPSSFSSATSSLSSSSSDLHASPVESAINELITKLKNEQVEILLICSRLSSFLRANAITPYNDDIVEYIKLFINEEQIKHQAGAQNSEVIRGLEASLEAYKQEMKLFEMTMVAGNDLTMTVASNYKEVPKLEEIFLLVESLYALPINGEQIRQQVENLKKSQSTNVRRREQIIQLPSSTTSSTVTSRLQKTLT